MSSKKSVKSKEASEIAKLKNSLQKKNKELRNNDLFVDIRLPKTANKMTIEELQFENEELATQISLQEEVQYYDLSVSPRLLKIPKIITIEELQVQNKKLSLEVSQQKKYNNIKANLSEALLRGDAHRVTQFFYDRRGDFDENLSYYLKLFHELPSCNEKRQSFLILVDMLSPSYTRPLTRAQFYVEYHYRYPNDVDMKFNEFRFQLGDFYS